MQTIYALMLLSISLLLEAAAVHKVAAAQVAI
jgi:hypothetical protein